MNTPAIVSPQQWEAAREQLLVKEKALTRARDALAAERRRMPWMAVEKAYRFDGPEGPAPSSHGSGPKTATNVPAGTAPTLDVNAAETVPGTKMLPDPGSTAMARGWMPLLAPIVTEPTPRDRPSAAATRSGASSPLPPFAVTSVLPLASTVLAQGKASGM